MSTHDDWFGLVSLASGSDTPQRVARLVLPSIRDFLAGTSFGNPQWGAHVNENIGAGTLTYRAVQDPRAPTRTLWRFTIYGVVMGDAAGWPGVSADAIYGASNPPRT
ncbi:hypothetical protein [Paraburkholderia mimosarum]|uniref:hypothetical protein n=1 Tax=Paraburkholderia mimosarum TaxID=312026 RepID=UPI00138DFCF9|nr:hypothetical protein [Paraburkholderia mimosarum]